MTKFLNCNADIAAGIVATKTGSFCEKLKAIIIKPGYNIDPHPTYMVIIGLKPLAS